MRETALRRPFRLPFAFSLFVENSCGIGLLTPSNVLYGAKARVAMLHHEKPLQLLSSRHFEHFIDVR
jgi:hypothetical protein